MWARVVSALLGAWLMAAPALLGYGPPGAINDRIVGPLVVAVAVMAGAQVLRPLRWFGVPLGLWLLVAPLLLGGYPFPAALNGALVGLALTGLAFVSGKLTHRFGGGWREIWRL